MLRFVFSCVHKDYCREYYNYMFEDFDKLTLDNFNFDLYINNGDISEKEFLNKAEEVIRHFNVYRGKTKLLI